MKKFSGNPELKKWHKLMDGVKGFEKVTETPDKIILNFDNEEIVAFIMKNVGSLPGVTQNPTTLEISKLPKEFADNAWDKLMKKKIDLQLDNLPWDKSFKPKP